jgi:hypothetical protein
MTNMNVRARINGWMAQRPVRVTVQANFGRDCGDLIGLAIWTDHKNTSGVKTMQKAVQIAAVD